MVGGGGGALVSCKRRLASPPHPDRRPVALPPSSFQSPALLRAQESWFTQCLGAFEAGYWNFNPSFPFIPDTPAPSAMVFQVPPFPRPQQTLKANLGGGLLIQPSSALRVRDCPSARLGWSGGVMVGATGQGSISLTQCHPSGCMRPWHSGPRCLPVWLPSSWPSCFNMQEFQEWLWGCRAQPGTEAAEEGGAHALATLLPLAASVGLPLHCLCLLSLGPCPTQALASSCLCLPLSSLPDPTSVYPCPHLAPAPYLCLHPSMGSSPYLVLPLFCLYLLLADFSLHRQIGEASLILSYLATEAYDKYLLVMIIIWGTLPVTSPHPVIPI